MCVRERLVFSILLIAGLAFRVYAAVFYACSTNTDLAVGAQMSKHIAEGRHFPLFFYGQAYMGTIEAYVSAVFYRLMPHSLLPIMLGWGLVAFLAIPCFHFWTRRLFGVRAALLALPLLVIGPQALFYFNVFMGYPIMLFTGLAGCWITVRILNRELLPRQARRWFDFFLLGLVVGLGWWSNTLSLAFLLPCALILLAGVPWKRLLPMGPVTLLGIALGAGPWIIYTIKQPDALMFVSQVSTSPGAGLGATLRVALGLILPLFGVDLNGPDLPGSLGGLLFLALAVLSLPILCGLVPKCRGRQGWHNLLLHAMPWLIIAANLALCAVSARFAHVPAHRYLLPLIPACAALAGLTLSRISRTRTGLAGALLPLLLIVAIQFATLPNHWDRQHVSRLRETDRNVQEMVAFAEQHGVDAFSGDWFTQWKTFRTAERLILSCYPRFDRYRPHRAIMALATNPAVINNHYGVLEFLAATDGHAEESTVGKNRLTWNMQRRPPALRYLMPEQILSIKGEDGRDLAALYDMHLDTPLAFGNIDREWPHTHDRTAVIKLREAAHLSGIHTWGPSGIWEGIQRLEIRMPDGTWREIHGERPAGWFWSGPKPFLHGYLAHYERLFSPAETDEIRLTLRATPEGIPLVTEVWLLEETRPAGDNAPANNILDILKAGKGVSVFAPRYLSEQIHRHAPAVETIIPRAYYEQYDGFDRHERRYVTITPAGGDLLVVPALAAARTEQVLAAQGWTFEKEASWPWLIFRLGSRAHAAGMAEHLYWTEYGPFAGSALFPPDRQKPESPSLIERAVQFRNKGRLEQFHTVEQKVRKGEPVQLEYGWHCPPHLNPNRWAVFVHFIQDGKVQFQGDHVWLAEVRTGAIRHQPESWVFLIKQAIAIPPDAPSGSYDIRIGLYDRVSNRRVKLDRHAQGKGESVLVPDAFSVE